MWNDNYMCAGSSLMREWEYTDHTKLNPHKEWRVFENNSSECPLTPPPPQEGEWADNYRCLDSTLQREWLYTNGITEWRDYEYHSISCPNVIPKPPISEQTLTEKIVSLVKKYWLVIIATIMIFIGLAVVL